MEKAVLDKLLDCLLILAGVDGLDDSEMTVIESFMTSYWTEDPSLLRPHIHDRLEALPDPAQKQKLFKEHVKALSLECDHELKATILKLMEDVIMADNVFTYWERGLYTILKSTFQPDRP